MILYRTPHYLELKILIEVVHGRSFCSISNHSVYAVISSDPDMPSFNEAVHGELYQQYVEATKSKSLLSFIRIFSKGSPK